MEALKKLEQQITELSAEVKAGQREIDALKLELLAAQHIYEGRAQASQALYRAAQIIRNDERVTSA